MLENWREQRSQKAQARQASKAQTALQEQRSAWELEEAELQAQLELVTSFKGEAAAGILMQPGEAAFAQIHNSSLMGEVREAGQFVAGSQGLSFPIGSLGGRSIRYRVGRTKGHFEQGEVHTAGIDQGELVITNQRILFLGAKKTIECKLSKALSVHADEDGMLTVSVSNRQAPMVVSFGSTICGWLSLRLDLALAVFRGDTEALADRIRQDLAEHASTKPA